jgi:hypothetical protein
MTGRALYFANVHHKHIVCPEALQILKLNNKCSHLPAVQIKIVVISRACNELDSISSHGIFIPVGDPIEG